MNALICLAAVVAIAVVEGHQSTWVKEHNKHRTMHHANPVSWNPEAAEKARSWAETMASTGTVGHGNNVGLGQNIHHNKNANECSEEQRKQAVDNWYSEEKNYFYRTAQSKFGRPVAHFTQLVWKATSTIGCACSASAKGVFTVCNYNPPGNQSGQFNKNVQKQ